MWGSLIRAYSRLYPLRSCDLKYQTKMASQCLQSRYFVSDRVVVVLLMSLLFLVTFRVCDELGWLGFGLVIYFDQPGDDHKETMLMNMKNRDITSVEES